MTSNFIEDETILENIAEVKKILSSNDGKLIKSRISPEDYFTNLSYDGPKLKYPDVGISKTVVNICELVSSLLLEDYDETRSISKIIVMIFEYYFLVSPILFKSQGPRYTNDLAFMITFTEYIKSLCNSRTQAQKELGNLLVAIDLYDKTKDKESSF